MRLDSDRVYAPISNVNQFRIDSNSTIIPRVAHLRPDLKPQHPGGALEAHKRLILPSKLPSLPVFSPNLGDYPRFSSKDPGPEGPALGYPLKGLVYIAIFLLEYWSVGVVKYCKSNGQKTSGYIAILEDTVFSEFN